MDQGSDPGMAHATVGEVCGMQATALQLLEEDVRELVRRRRLDPTRDDLAVRDLVREVLDDYDDRALVSGLGPLADRDEAQRLLVESVAGFGPLQPYLDAPDVEEIWINEPANIRKGFLHWTTLGTTRARYIPQRPGPLSWRVGEHVEVAEGLPWLGGPPLLHIQFSDGTWAVCGANDLSLTHDLSRCSPPSPTPPRSFAWRP